MKKRRYLLLFIIVVFVLSSSLNLPEDYRVKFSLLSLKVDRVIQRPRININTPFFSVEKDFSSRLGLDLAGGTHLVLEAEMENISVDDREKAFDAARNIVEKRVNLYGLTEPIIQQSKVGSKYRIIVEIPGVSDVSEAVELIGQTASLSFVEEASPSSEARESQSSPSSILQNLTKPTGLTGSHLEKAEVTFDPSSGKPVVSLEFSDEGKELFADITRRNVGRTLAIFLDDQLVSFPQVRTPIEDGRAVIEGDFTIEQAKHLATTLNAGALPVPLKIIEQRNIGATLGTESVEKSLTAGAVGLFIIFLFMIYTYGFLGLVANVALVIYILVTLAIFRSVPVTLTLAGIAGFILSIGMAVDANILIFERTKEEVRWGSNFSQALDLGFKRAFPSIRDSNISSLITCAILYWFGTSIVRGFAITLAIGILVSLFSAIIVTRTFLQTIYKSSV